MIHMYEENEYLLSTMEKFNIDSLVDLSILDLITLQLLLRKQKPVIRYSLYVEVREFFKDIKDIPSSSFYNVLKKLRKRGFIIFRHNENKKKKIEATPSAEAAIKSVNSYFMSALVHNSNVGNEQILKEMGVSNWGKILILSMSDFMNLDLFPFLIEHSDKIYIVTKESVFKDLCKIGIKNIELSKIENGVIREPDNFFDASSIPFYFKKPRNYGTTRIELLKELVRVTKPRGLVVIASRAKPPKTNNFFANEAIRIYSETIRDRIFTEQELRQDMEEAGLVEIKTLEHQGIVAAIGKKPVE